MDAYQYDSSELGEEMLTAAEVTIVDPRVEPMPQQFECEYDPILSVFSTTTGSARFNRRFRVRCPACGMQFHQARYLALHLGTEANRECREEVIELERFQWLPRKRQPAVKYIANTLYADYPNAGTNHWWRIGFLLPTGDICEPEELRFSFNEAKDFIEKVQRWQQRNKR